MRAGSAASRAGRHAVQATLEALLILGIIISLAFATALVTGAASPGAADTVLAGKGNGNGGGGGGGKPPRSSATLVVSPNPVAAGGATFTISGAGYPAGKLVAISLANPGCCIAFNVLASSGGTISFERTTGTAGTYYVWAYQYGTTKLLAKTSFTVE